MCLCLCLQLSGACGPWKKNRHGHYSSCDLLKKGPHLWQLLLIKLCWQHLRVFVTSGGGQNKTNTCVRIMWSRSTTAPQIYNIKHKSTGLTTSIKGPSKVICAVSQELLCFLFNTRLLSSSSVNMTRWTTTETKNTKNPDTFVCSDLGLSDIQHCIIGLSSFKRIIASHTVLPESMCDRDRLRISPLCCFLYSILFEISEALKQYHSALHSSCTKCLKLCFDKVVVSNKNNTQELIGCYLSFLAFKCGK